MPIGYIILTLLGVLVAVGLLYGVSRLLKNFDDQHESTNNDD